MPQIKSIFTKTGNDKHLYRNQQFIIVFPEEILFLSQRVLDHENWIMDLDNANTRNETEFTLLYTAKDAYKLVRIVF